MDFMRAQRIKRDYEERTGEAWPGFGESERRKIAAERAQEEGQELGQEGNPGARGVHPIFSDQRRKRRRFK